MKKIIFGIVAAVIVFLMALGYSDAMHSNAEHSSEGGLPEVNPKEIIFEHLGDAYGWELPFAHHRRTLCFSRLILPFLYLHKAL